MKKVTVAEGQTTWDIALEHYGSVEGFFRVIDDNPEVFDSLNVILQAGTILNIDESAVIDKTVVEYYRLHGVKPVSGLINGGFSEGFDDGFEIGFFELGGAYSEGFDNGFLIYN